MGTSDIDMTLDEIKKMSEGITKGEWIVQWYSGEDMPNRIVSKDTGKTICESGIPELMPGDAEFIAQSPQIVKFLLEKLEETRIRFEAARSVAIRETTPGPNVIEWIDEEILDEMKRLKENK